MNKALRRLGTIAIASLGLAAAEAPVITLEGVVFDRTRQEPVVGATVTLVAAQRSATTDEGGNFSFGGFEVTGPDQITISHPEYGTARLPLGSLSSGPWHIVVSLVPEPYEVGDQE